MTSRVPYSSQHHRQHCKLWTFELFGALYIAQETFSGTRALCGIRFGYGAVRECPGGGPRVVVSTAAFHARVRGTVPGLGGLKETKMFLPHPRVKVSIVGSLRDREVACSASDRQGSNFESCVWRTVSSQSSHHPQEVLLAQFCLYVYKGGLKPDSFHLREFPATTCVIRLEVYSPCQLRWLSSKPTLGQRLLFARYVTQTG